MFYFKSSKGEVFAFESEEDRAKYGQEDLVKMSVDEVDYHLRPKIIHMSRSDIEELRLRAYAHPVTGSDRYKSEAEAERLLGDENAAKAAEAKMLARREEIRAEYPWPEE